MKLTFNFPFVYFGFWKKTRFSKIRFYTKQLHLNQETNYFQYQLWLTIFNRGNKGFLNPTDKTFQPDMSLPVMAEFFH